MVLEHEAFTVVEKLINGVLPKTIAIHLETTLLVPFEAALNFVKELEERVLNSSITVQEKSIIELSKVTIPDNFTPGHSWQGLFFFIKSRPLFIKSAFLGVFMIKPPFL